MTHEEALKKAEKVAKTVRVSATDEGSVDISFKVDDANTYIDYYLKIGDEENENEGIVLSIWKNKQNIHQFNFEP